MSEKSYKAATLVHGFCDIVKSYTEDSDTEEQWIVEAYAATNDVDADQDELHMAAMKHMDSDLEIYSTVLFNHDIDKPIGKVVEHSVDEKGMFLKIFISKTVPLIWKQIQEGVLSKMSYKARVLKWAERVTGESKRVRSILDATLFETSVVSVPANGNAATVAAYITKALNEENEKKNPIDEGGVKSMPNDVKGADDSALVSDDAKIAGETMVSDSVASAAVVDKSQLEESLRTVSVEVAIEKPAEKSSPALTAKEIISRAMTVRQQVLQQHQQFFDNFKEVYVFLGELADAAEGEKKEWLNLTRQVLYHFIYGEMPKATPTFTMVRYPYPYPYPAAGVKEDSVKDAIDVGSDKSSVEGGLNVESAVMSADSKDTGITSAEKLLKETRALTTVITEAIKQDRDAAKKQADAVFEDKFAALEKQFHRIMELLETWLPIRKGLKSEDSEKVKAANKKSTSKPEFEIDPAASPTENLRSLFAHHLNQ